MSALTGMTAAVRQYSIGGMRVCLDDVFFRKLTAVNRLSQAAV
jgi:hypothetical protein